MLIILGTQEVEIRRITVQSQLQANSSQDPISKISVTKKGLASGSSGRVPASNHEALSSNSSTTKKEKIKLKPTVVVHACYLSTLGCRDLKDNSSRPAWTKS
jgi:hypothetical protein